MAELSKEALRSRARRAAAKLAKDPVAFVAAQAKKAAAPKPVTAKPKAKPFDAIVKAKPQKARKPEPTSNRLIVISFKGTPAHKATFQGLGGGAWLRPMLDKRA